LESFFNLIGQDQPTIQDFGKRGRLEITDSTLGF